MSWMVRIDGAVDRKSFRGLLVIAGRGGGGVSAGAVKRKGWGCLWMMAAGGGGMSPAGSISPFWSAATRTASWGIAQKTIVLFFGAPRQYRSFASRTISSSFDQRTNL